MHDFWLSSGYMLLDRGDHGGLILTDEFLKAYLARPELVPPEEACDAERAIHARLLETPRAAVSRAELDAIADGDARENWSVMLEFRDRLTAAPTLEAAYAALVRNGVGRIPPLFINQLTHVILRNALDGVDDPFLVRAAEIFFRPQRVAVDKGRVMLADLDVIDLQEHKIHSSPLLAMFAGETAHMDVLGPDNSAAYWERSDAFDMILDLGGLDGGRAAIARALEIWVRHVLGVHMVIRPIERIEDKDVRWMMGLDAEATKIANTLWAGEDVDDALSQNLLAIFEARAQDPSTFSENVRERPVYILLAMNGDRIVRMKPQNLVTGLPLRELIPA
jgi:hypothetical protein